MTFSRVDTIHPRSVHIIRLISSDLMSSVCRREATQFAVAVTNRTRWRRDDLPIVGSHWVASRRTDWHWVDMRWGQMRW